MHYTNKARSCICMILLLHLAIVFNTVASKVNLLNNGGFEQLNTDPIRIEPEDFLPAMQLPGASQNMGVTIPAELEQWGFISFGLPKSLEPCQYKLEIHYFGNDANASEIGFYLLEGGSHQLICRLPVIGDGKFHTYTQKFSTGSVSTEIIFKKWSEGKKASNPIDWIRFTPIHAQPSPLEWGKMRLPGSLVSWSLDDEVVRSGRHSALIDDVLGGSGGWQSNYFSIGQQEYELLGWVQRENAQDAVASVGVQWYSDSEQMIKQDSLKVPLTEEGRWQQFKLTVSPPARANGAKIVLIVKDLVGRVWFDDIAFIGDSSVIRKGNPAPINMWGKLVTEVYYRPECSLVGSNRLELWSNLPLGPVITGSINLNASWEGDKQFTDSPQMFNRGLQQVKLRIDGKQLPLGLISALDIGMLDINYSPYIATIGCSISGGWIAANGIRIEARLPQLQGDLFSFWDRTEQVIGSKLVSNIWGTSVSGAGVGILDHTIEGEQTKVWNRGEIKEKAISLEAERKILDVNVSSIYSALSSNSQDSQMWRFRLEPDISLPWLTANYEAWFCHPEYKPRFHEKSTRGYDPMYKRFSEGNWVDNHRGQQGQAISSSLKLGNLTIRNKFESYKNLSKDSIPTRTKWGVYADYVRGNDRVRYELERRFDKLSFLGVNEEKPFWFRTSLEVDHKLKAGSPNSIGFLGEKEEINCDLLTGYELRLTHRQQQNEFYIGYKLQNENSVNRGFFKAGCNLTTPGGINVSLVYSNPNLPHQGYYDPIREKWYEVDNEFRISASVGF